MVVWCDAVAVIPVVAISVAGTAISGTDVTSDGGAGDGVWAGKGSGNIPDSGSQ